MGRWLAWLMVVSLVVASCAGGDTVDSTTTASTTSTTATSTTIAETTTTSDVTAAPKAITGPMPLEPDQSYIASGFAVPIRIEAPSEGWVVSYAFERALHLRVDGTRTGLTFLAYRVDSLAEDLFADMTDQESDIVVLAAPMPAAVAGLSATTFDLRINEHPTFGCDSSVGVGGRGPAPIINFVTESDRDFGLARCATTRVWLASTDHGLITILGGTLDADRFEEVVPIFEDFLDNNVAFGDSDG